MCARLLESFHQMMLAINEIDELQLWIRPISLDIPNPRSPGAESRRERSEAPRPLAGRALEYAQYGLRFAPAAHIQGGNSLMGIKTVRFWLIVPYPKLGLMNQTSLRMALIISDTHHLLQAMSGFENPNVRVINDVQN